MARKTKPPKKAPAKGKAPRKTRSDSKAASKELVHISAYQICKEIKEGARKPEDLTDIQLDACIEYLRYELGHTNLEIAEFLKKHRHTIANHCRVIEEKLAQELANKGIDKYKVAARLYAVTEMIMSNARKAKDFRLELDAFHKMIEKFQSLGVLYEAPKKHEVSGAVEHHHKMLIGQAVELIQQHPEGERDKLVRLFAERYGKRPPVQS